MSNDDKYKMLFETSRDGIVLIDADTALIVDCNAEYQKLTGKTIEQLRRMEVWETRPPDQRDARKKAFREIIERGHGIGEGDYIRDDGYIIHSEYLSRLLTIDGKKYVQSVVRDDTERVNKEKELDQYRHHLEQMVQIRTKELTNIISKLEESITECNRRQDQINIFEHKLHELTMEYIKAQENERKLLAAELHDRVVQDLVHLCHQLGEVIEESSGSNRTSNVTILEGVKNTLNETRGIMKSLYPVTLARYGLVEMIKQELETLREKTGLLVHLTVAFDGRLNQVTETTLYRVFHEAVLNVMKHCRTAKEVFVILERHGDTVEMSVSDDGKGFDTNQILTGEPGGIEGMRQRTELIGGTFNVTSTLGEGTIILVTVPSK